MQDTQKHDVFWFLMMLCLILISACGGSTEKSAGFGLPLAEGKPSFLFFYTDN